MSFEAGATSFSMANAQVLAQAAAVAYKEPARCESWARTRGFTGAFDFFDNDDTQGFVAESPEAVVVAFRGTQPNRKMDWFADAEAIPRVWDHDTGKVHTGFYKALRAVWGKTLPNGKQVLPQRLEARGNKTIWITGHSLGGALAELCAAQTLFVSRIPVQGVYTFGQPRVGNKEFADAVAASLGSGIFRFVNHRDIVPRVPLFTAGFCHYGHQTFFDEDGASTDQPSAVETLASALKFGAGVFNLHILSQARDAVKEGLKHALGSDELTADHEKAFRDTALRILRLGIEKIDDHGMEKHYLARLKTSLP
jgi:triacylglycerol lipase